MPLKCASCLFYDRASMFQPRAASVVAYFDSFVTQGLAKKSGLVLPTLRLSYLPLLTPVSEVPGR